MNIFEKPTEFDRLRHGYLWLANVADCLICAAGSEIKPAILLLLVRTVLRAFIAAEISRTDSR